MVLNSVMTNNRAIGYGTNPASPGTAGGGSGGAIYTDGNKYSLKVEGTVIRGNHAREGGGPPVSLAAVSGRQPRSAGSSTRR